MRRTIEFVAMAIALSAPADLAAQTAHITGTVTDPSGGRIAYVEVDIPNSTFHTLGTYDGRFSLGPLPNGTYRVRIRKFGFTPRLMSVTVTDTDTLLRIVLAPLPTTLDTVQTTALEQDLPRVFDRARQGISVLKFGPELMKEFPDRSLDEILSFDSDYFHQLMGYWCHTSVYLDGRKLPIDPKIPSPPSARFAGPGSEISDFVRMRDIAAVEAIRVPVMAVRERRFIGNPGASCKHMILIWTKGFKQKPLSGGK